MYKFELRCCQSQMLKKKSSDKEIADGDQAKNIQKRQMEKLWMR